MKRIRFSVIVAAAAFVVSAFAGGVRAEMIYGFTSAQPVDSNNYTALNLVRFDSSTPGTIITVAPISGILANHTLRSIDFRPLTGQLYGISNLNTNYATAQLYTINLTTGVASPVGGLLSLSGGQGGQAGPNDKPQLEIEFNPVVDRIRILTAGNEVPTVCVFCITNNLRAHPDTGALVQADGVLRYADGDLNSGAADIQVTAAAYTRNIGGQTTLYAWDQGDDTLATVGDINGTPGSPNSGVLHTVHRPASVFTFANSALGMDISPDTGIAYVSLITVQPGPFTPPTHGLYTRDLSTGAISPQPAAGTNVFGLPANTYMMDISVARTTTAAGVSVSGRLVVSEGARGGLTNAVVVLKDMSGSSISTTTGKGGAFTFDNVESGRTYIISVKSKLYYFEPQVVEVQDSVSGLVLVASGGGGRR